MGSGIDTTYPYTSASSRGWGSGWPNCQTSKWVTAPAPISGKIHQRVRDLCSLLMAESERRGYITFRSGQCWGADCRPVKNPDGSLTNTPSNHSWGLAVDLNAPANPYGGSSHEIPGAMGDLWNAYGWGWGGDYPSTKDWMHFEFVGTPAQADSMTAAARDAFGIGEDEMDTDFSKGYQSAWDSFVDGKKRPADFLNQYIGGDANATQRAQYIGKRQAARDYAQMMQTTGQTSNPATATVDSEEPGG